MGLLYRGPALVRLGDLREEVGDRAGAAVAYERAEKLLAGCDTEFERLIALRRVSWR